MDAAMEKRLLLLNEATRCCCSDDEYMKNISSVQAVLKRFLPDIYLSHPVLCLELESKFRKLKEYAAYKQLLKKNIVSLCGRTSSGKSSFFNSIYNGGILPVDTDSGSAVPVYAVCGSSQNIYGLNRFDHFVTMEQSDLNTVFNGTSGSSDSKLPLSQLFSSILTYASAPELKHIAFLDTPGYNKTGENLSASEEYRLIQRINSSNYILWFADINILNLGISENDIRILKKIDPSIPKLIIISKADAFNTREVPEIIEKTKKILNARGVNYIDVLTYSRFHPEKFDKYKILAYLDRWDKSPAIINFSQEFETVFDSVPDNQKLSEFRAALMPEIQEASSMIYNIQNVFETAKKENSEEFVSVESTQKPVNPLKNIDISKIKITDLPIPNPEKLFRNYNDRNKIDTSAYERYINSVSIVLTEKMRDIVPVFSVSAKAEKIKTEISSVIAGHFKVTESADENKEAASKTEPETKNEERSKSRRSRSTRSSRREPEPETKETEENNEEVSRPSRERSSSLPSRRRLR